MGKKIVGLYGFLCLLSFALISISCFNKWYQQVFKTFGFKTVLKLEVSLLTGHIPGESILFCDTIKRWFTNIPPRCQEIKDPTPLQDLAADWCAPMVFSMWPVPCQAFNTAYVLGLCVIIVYALNVLFLGVCFYLLYYYVTSKSHKPIYRTWAAILHGIGTTMLAVVCILYTILAMMRLNSLGGTGIPGFFEASQSVGMTPGYFLVWVGIICQYVALGLHGCMKVSGEETEEQRMYKDMLKEQQQYGAIEAQMQGPPMPSQGQMPPAESYYGGHDAYAEDAYAQQMQYGAATYAQTDYGAVQMPAAMPAPMPAPMPAAPAPEYAVGPHMPPPGGAHF